jgi:hypothetical protein
MFEKKRVAFSRKEIFGLKFKPTIDICFLAVAKMLFSERINIDGTIDINQSINLKKEELWSYVYYLYFYNHSNVEIFQSMKNKKDGKASAELFYSTVVSFTGSEAENTYTNVNVNSHPAKSFDNVTLIIFINNVIEDYGKVMVNPIFDYLSILMKKNVLTRLSGITIKTGDDNGNNSNKIKIVTNNANVANANVKIKFEVENELFK